MSEKLRDESKKFSWGARKLNAMVCEHFVFSCYSIRCAYQTISLNLQAMYRKYAPLAAVALIVVGALYYRFFM